MPRISASAATRSASCGRKASARAFVQWPAAIAISALFALVIGALSLRTRGVYFIMITLAFAQMIYYVAQGLDRYGGDDGLTIGQRSSFAGLIDLNNNTLFYYLCFAAAYRQHLSGLPARQFALRPGHPGRAIQRAAHARHRLSDVPLQARLLRHCRRAVRALPARSLPTTPISSARRSCSGRAPAISWSW